MPGPCVSVQEVATHLGGAKDSVYWRIENKGLPVHTTGIAFKFKLSEVDVWACSRLAPGDDRESSRCAWRSVRQAGKSAAHV